MFGFDISPDKVKGFCCTASDPIYMGASGQATGDINPKIPGTGDSFQDVATETVVCIKLAYWNLSPELPGISRGGTPYPTAAPTQTVCQSHVAELRCLSRLQWSCRYRAVSSATRRTLEVIVSGRSLM